MAPRYFTYSWIKDNLSLVVLVPTVLGGSWQVLELVSIGTPYVRFFSVTQLVSDGLMILFVIAMIYLIAWIALKDTDLFETMRNRKPKLLPPPELAAEAVTPPVSKKRKVGYLLFILAIFAGFLLEYFIPLIKAIASHQNLYTIEIVFIVFGVLIFLVMTKTFISALFRAFNWKISLTEARAKEVVKYIALLLILATLYGLIHVIPILHHSYLFADDFKNKDYIACKIRKNNPDIKSFDIRYFNDKYIFVDLTLKNNTDLVEVLKFEDFLNDGACDIKKP